MFSIGDMIVHPMHGAGVIDSIVEQRVSGKNLCFYVLRMPMGMLMMIPTVGYEEIGVRPVIEADRANEVISLLPGVEVEMTANWNRRYRENMLRIKSGDLLEVAKVVKGLTAREKERGLSTGERKMLSSAKQILISELVLALKADYDQIEGRIDSILSA